MGKFFTTSEDICELIRDEFSKTDLESYGINLNIMSTKKSKDVINVTKANARTEFIIKQEDVIQVCVYEAAFDRLTDDVKQRLVEMALSIVHFDSEKNKLTVDSNPYTQLFNGSRKYGAEVALNTIELSYMTIAQIEEEEKARKEEEKASKKKRD